MPDAQTPEKSYVIPQNLIESILQYFAKQTVWEVGNPFIVGIRNNVREYVAPPVVEPKPEANLTQKTQQADTDNKVVSMKTSETATGQEKDPVS